MLNYSEAVYQSNCKIVKCTCDDLPILFPCSEGQPDSIVADIDNMVKSYVEKVSQHSFQYNLLCTVS